MTKIEPPAGDMVRGVDDPDHTGVGSYFMGLNRNKRFARIDLATEQGRTIARRLCLGADVVVENHRPGTMQRLGLAYEQLRDDNPALVYTSISAFGESGPLRDKPGMDIIVQGFAGIMGVTGLPGGAPVKVGAPVADLATGYAAAMGTLAALFERAASGLGQRVSLSLLNVVASLLSNVTTGHLRTGAEVPRMGSAHPQLVPYQAFRALDDEYIVIGILNERFWHKLALVLNDREIAADPRFTTNRGRVRHRDALIDLLDERFARQPVAHWAKLCDQHDVPYSRVNTLRDLFSHPQAAAEGLVVELQHDALGQIPTIAQAVRLDRTPVSYHAPPSSVGAHTDQVLTELGFTAEGIQTLARDGVI